MYTRIYCETTKSDILYVLNEKKKKCHDYKMCSWQSIKNTQRVIKRVYLFRELLFTNARNDYNYR